MEQDGLLDEIKPVPFEVLREFLTEGLEPARRTTYMPSLRDIPSLSSRKLVRLLERHGAMFVRQRGTSHAIYERWVGGERKRAPVVMGERELAPKYIRLVLRQRGFGDDESRRMFGR